MLQLEWRADGGAVPAWKTTKLLAEEWLSTRLRNVYSAAGTGEGCLIVSTGHFAFAIDDITIQPVADAVRLKIRREKPLTHS